MVLLDEAQEWMEYELLQKFVRKILDTERKRGVRALIVTLTPAHLEMYPSLMASIKSGCATKFFAPDASVFANASHYRALGVTEPELERISKMQLGTYLLRNQFGSREFQLRAGPIAKMIAGMSTPDELALLERVSEESGHDAERLLDALLRHHGLSKAAEQLEKVVPWKTPDEFCHAAE